MTAPPEFPYIEANRHGGGGNKPIRRIVMHATVSGCYPGAAKDIALYFAKTDRAASAHYAVDPQSVFQCVWDSQVAYHAPPNEGSIGVELCCSLSNKGLGHWRRANHAAMLALAATEVVAPLAAAYDVPVRRIKARRLRRGEHGMCGHADVRDAWRQTTHWDPGPHFPWRPFMGMVTGRGPSKPPIISRWRPNDLDGTQEPHEMDEGSGHTYIAATQRRLARAGYDLNVDGMYGPATEKQVRQFQRDAGIKVDGLFGPQTRQALRRALRGNVEDDAPDHPDFPLPSGHWYGPPAASPRNHSGFWRRDRAGVTLVQRRLRQRGHDNTAGDPLVVDGRYGPETARAITMFQRQAGLAVDGLVGEETWPALWTAPEE